jgi:hypothetical protein
MPDEKQDKPKLPLPKWCFLLLGVPTFYMPLAYLSLAVCVVGWLIIGRPQKIPGEWLAAFAGPSLYVTFALWPIYIGWVVFSKRLTLREKGLWLVIVFFLNMLGMPWFYVFMVRRYLGIEGRTGPRDEAALDSFLMKCGIGRGSLSAAQIDLLRSHCRNHKRLKWAGIVMVALAVLFIYVAAVSIPKLVVPWFSEGAFTPTHYIIVDTAKNSRKEIAPDPETQRMQVEIIMMLGAWAGMSGMMGLFFLGEAVSSLWGNADQRVLIAFLKASKRSDRIASCADPDETQG